MQILGGMWYLWRLHPLMATTTGVGLVAISIITALHGRFSRRIGRATQVL
jgi:hypothetical protein